MSEEDGYFSPIFGTSGLLEEMDMEYVYRPIPMSMVHKRHILQAVRRPSKVKVYKVGDAGFSMFGARPYPGDGCGGVHPPGITPDGSRAQNAVMGSAITDMVFGEIQRNFGCNGCVHYVRFHGRPDSDEMECEFGMIVAFYECMSKDYCKKEEEE